MLPDYINKKIYERKLKLLRRNLDPSQIYKTQKESIARISGTNGFHEIVNYFSREKELHEIRLRQIEQSVLSGKSINDDHLKVVMASHAVCEKFLTWLINLIEATPVLHKDEIGEVTD